MKGKMLMQLIEATDVGCSYLTANDFNALLHKSAPGQPFVYFIGNLATDVFHANKNKSPHAREMQLTKDLAFEASETGMACLTQRLVSREQNGANVYEYRLTRRSGSQ